AGYLRAGDGGGAHVGGASSLRAVSGEPATEDRRRFLGVLAKAPPEELEQCWQALGIEPRYRHLRAPETGLVMVRGRIGGTGAPFNLGEMTVTRCSVVLEDGTIGPGYVGGADAGHAGSGARCDALVQ